MVREDYEKIAGVFKNYIENYATSGNGENAVKELAHDLADELKEANPWFNKDKFLEACGV